MRETLYDRAAAVAYAREWALGRNPFFYSFDAIGGDCTSFVSQCVFAGAGIMNFTPVFGWYYLNSDLRTASWTGVEFFYDFMTKNRSAGPYARPVPREMLLPGDVVQLGRADGDFYHTLLVSETRPSILVCAHTDDALDRPLADYRFDTARYLKIAGVRLF